MNQNNTSKLIHIAKYLIQGQGIKTLFLRQTAPHHYIWLEKNGPEEKKTEVEAFSIEEAIRLAHRTWKNLSFRTIICGFRYTLPERDEHGMNALFHQLEASHNSPNGIYFDKELGHSCFVQNPSSEALNFLNQLKDSHP